MKFLESIIEIIIGARAASILAKAGKHQSANDRISK